MLHIILQFQKNQEVLFSEVFACVEIPGAVQIKGENLLEVKRDNFNYSFSSEVFNIAVGHCTRIEKFKLSSTLIYEFGNEEESAITGMIFNQLDDSIQLETIHVYPNEKKAIITNSSFDLRD